jgi:ABC-type transporter Mla subunit MlaD
LFSFNLFDGNATYTDSTSQNHSTTQDSLSELKKSIEGTKEDLEDQLERVQETISNTGAALRDILQADQAQLQRGSRSLVQAQKVADTARPQIVIERNRGGEESRALFGTNTSQPHFNLTVSENEAQCGAVMAAGSIIQRRYKSC